MKIISYNVNGLRAVMKKGFMEWLAQTDVDVLCLQEVKARQEDVDIKAFKNLGFYDNWFCAEKRGYSGVAIFSKTEPTNVICGTGHKDSDMEGRVLTVEFGALRVMNAYFPSGTSGALRQDFKYAWLNEFLTHLQTFSKPHTRMLLCGDYNIAHKEIDIHNPKGNKNTSGFLPEERAWMDRFFESGWIDTFRHFHAAPHRYSWWSQRFPGVRAANKGWRIDYIAATPALQPFLKDAEMYPDVCFSDHCPVYVAIDDAALNANT